MVGRAFDVSGVAQKSAIELKFYDHSHKSNSKIYMKEERKFKNVEWATWIVYKRDVKSKCAISPRNFSSLSFPYSSRLTPLVSLHFLSGSARPHHLRNAKNRLLLESSLACASPSALFFSAKLSSLHSESRALISKS